MIDHITLLGPWKAPSQSVLSHLPSLTYTKDSLTKLLPARYFVNSPLSGKQLTVELLHSSTWGPDVSAIKLTIPLASVLMGHNWLHAGLGALKHEVACLQLLVPVLLHHVGMNEAEVDRYLKASVLARLEVTWHTPCASVKARDKSQERTRKSVKLRGALKHLHGIPIAGYNFQESDTGQTIYAKLKSGAGFKQYGKDLQIKARRKDERLGRLDSKVAARLKKILVNVLPGHNRNELVFVEAQLQASDIRALHELTSVRLRRLIDKTWTELEGHRPAARFDCKKLSAVTRRYFDLYQRNTATVSTPAALRARRDIIKLGGPDIAVRRNALRFNAADHWDRLSYARREKVDGYTDLVVCRSTVDRLLDELASGLAYVRDGELPNLPEDKLAAWLERWRPLVRNR